MPRRVRQSGRTPHSDTSIDSGWLDGNQPFMNTLFDQSLVTHVAPPTLHYEPKRILVAADDSMMCGLVTATLEDAGHQVKTASNGEVAWAVH
jgi:hypothetical protein